MKKLSYLILLILSSFIVVFNLSGCDKKNLTPYVSQLRTNVFIGNYNGHDVTLYPEKKEFPFIADGKVGMLRLSVTVKLSGISSDNVSVEFLIDDVSYGGQMSFSVVQNALMLTLEVEKLPTSEITINVNEGDSSTPIKLTSVIKESIISYEKAIECVQKNKKEFISSLVLDGVFNAEIYVRLLNEDSRCFWYVGFAEENNKISSFLVDAKTGKILAERLAQNHPQPKG